MSIPSKNLPLVSIIIPCRNEERYIADCLDSVLNNDYPVDMQEIIIVDGNSEDRSVEIVNEYIEKYNHLRLLHNPVKTTPKSLNIGIKNSKGNIIMRMDVHSRYSKNYISVLVQSLDKYHCDNVGGIWNTLSKGSGIIPYGIATATSLPFGVGDAWYKIGGKKIMEVDTVPYGCYRREIFDKIGFFDEELVRNQDDEFNARLIKNGGKIYLIPDAIINYYARDSLKGMIQMFYQYGLYKPLVNKKIGAPANVRQLIPPAFVIFLIILFILLLVNPQVFKPLLLILAIYLIIDISYSLYATIKKRKFLLIFILPVLFPLIHFSYGIGYFFGIIYHRIISPLKRNNS